MTTQAETDWRHSGWAGTRNRVAAAMQRQGVAASRLERFRGCGSRAWVVRDAADPQRLAVVSNTCRDRWCLPCQQARARIVMSNLAMAVEHCACQFVTLTLRARAAGLRSEVDRLLQSFSQLRRLRWWKDRVTGGVAFIEITRGRKGDHWHVHLHAITFARNIPTGMLRDSWHAITGDSFVVDVQAVGADQASQSRVVQYVTKYASKGLNVCKLKDNGHLDEAMLALKGRRLMVPFGDLNQARLSERKGDILWVPVMSLSRLFSLANEGDIEARMLLEQLRSSRSAEHYADAELHALPPPTEQTP